MRGMVLAALLSGLIAAAAPGWAQEQTPREGQAGKASGETSVEISAIENRTVLENLLTDIIAVTGLRAENYAIEDNPATNQAGVVSARFGERSRLVLSVYTVPEELNLVAFSKLAQEQFTDKCTGQIVDYVFARFEAESVDGAVFSSSQCTAPGRGYRSSVLFLRSGEAVLSLRAGVKIKANPLNPSEDDPKDGEFHGHDGLMNILADKVPPIFKDFADRQAEGPAQ